MGWVQKKGILFKYGCQNKLKNLKKINVHHSKIDVEVRMHAIPAVTRHLNCI